MSKTLLREIRNIAVCVFILGVIQVLITVITGFFDTSAVLGTILGCGVAIFNFALMGFVLEKCVDRKHGAKGFTEVGYVVRLAIIGAATVWAIKADYFNYICMIIPLIFPQIAIFIINGVRRIKERKADKE